MPNTPVLSLQPLLQLPRASSTTSIQCNTPFLKIANWTSFMRVISQSTSRKLRPEISSLMIGPTCNQNSLYLKGGIIFCSLNLLGTLYLPSKYRNELYAKYRCEPIIRLYIVNNVASLIQSTTLGTPIKGGYPDLAPVTLGLCELFGQQPKGILVSLEARLVQIYEYVAEIVRENVEDIVLHFMKMPPDEPMYLPRNNQTLASYGIEEKDVLAWSNKEASEMEPETIRLFDEELFPTHPVELLFEKMRVSNSNGSYNGGNKGKKRRVLDTREVEGRRGIKRKCRIAGKDEFNNVNTIVIEDDEGNVSIGKINRY
eukprot:TRINITY_DN21376_c0_g2_i1.p1 TRINITY_DN21376_c0_g2~~TRINITY_DN21376_c0_g2_i1.p1  ORF type:complete len:314 (+),score=8.90 TRINITY_DN21376_c0_g2_i1:293-1234(+)